MRYKLVNESQLKDYPIKDQCHVGVFGDFILCPVNGGEWEVLMVMEPNSEYGETVVSLLNRAYDEGYQNAHRSNQGTPSVQA